MFSFTTKVVKDVILTDQTSWAPWFNSTKASVGNGFWRFFNPEGTDIFVEPIEPVEPLPELPPPIDQAVFAGPSTRSTPAPGETPAQQASREARNKSLKDDFFKDFSMYNQRLRK